MCKVSIKYTLSIVLSHYGVPKKQKDTKKMCSFYFAFFFLNIKKALNSPLAETNEKSSELPMHGWCCWHWLWRWWCCCLQYWGRGLRWTGWSLQPEDWRRVPQICAPRLAPTVYWKTGNFLVFWSDCSRFFHSRFGKVNE